MRIAKGIVYVPEKYRCDMCGETFEEPDEQTSSWADSYWGAPCTAEYTTEVCPYCGCDSAININPEWVEFDEEGEEEDAEAV